MRAANAVITFGGAVDTQTWIAEIQAEMDRLQVEAVLFGTAAHGAPSGNPVAWTSAQWHKWAWPSPLADHSRATALSYIGAVPS